MKYLIITLFMFMTACATQHAVNATPEAVAIPVEEKKLEPETAPEEKVDKVSVDFAEKQEAKNNIYVKYESSNPLILVEAKKAAKKKYASVTIQQAKTQKEISRVIIELARTETLSFFDKAKPFSLSITTYVHSVEVHSEKRLIEWADIQGKSMNVAAFLKEGYIVAIKVAQN